MSNNLLNSEAQALFVEVFRLRGKVEALKDKLDLAKQERSLLEKVMLLGRSQALRGWLARVKFPYVYCFFDTLLVLLRRQLDFVNLRLITYKYYYARLDDNFCRVEKRLANLEHPLMPTRLPRASVAMCDAYYALYDAQQEVACIMLDIMSLDLQKTLENYTTYDMLEELKTLFEEQAKQELFETVKAFHACKHEVGQSVSSYLLKMKGYLDTLECLGYQMPQELSTIAELNAMLKLTKKGLPKKDNAHVVLAIKGGKIQKNKNKKPQGAKGSGKGKGKQVYPSKLKIPPPPKKGNLEKDSIFHYCKELGHWKRNCPAYLVELKKKKNTSLANTSGLKSAKNITIAISSTEAEYITASEPATNKEPMEMLCDNTSVISITNEPGIIKGARHYQRKYHYIREVKEIDYLNLCELTLWISIIKLLPHMVEFLLILGLEMQAGLACVDNIS
nr:hypothetical protein [Tanacetum cinerariifolium]